MRRVLMFLLGISVGVGAGVLAAMLLAPASGEQMRREARAYYEQLLEEARKAADARRHELEMELKDLAGQGGDA